MKRIKILDCTQVRSDLPLFEGRCSDNGDKLQLVEFGTACEACRVFHNDGLKKGILIGIVAACIGITTTWALNKIITSDLDNQKDED